MACMPKLAANLPLLFGGADLPALKFDFLPRHSDRIGCAGGIGCEYNLAGNTVEGLMWAKPFL